MKGIIERNKRLTRLRLYLKMQPHLDELEQDERDALAFEYWHTEIADRVGNDEIESGWQCLMAATVGESVFVGPHRVCRGNLDELPVGTLVCATDGVIELVEFLYDAIPSNTTLDWANLFKNPPSWEFPSDSGSVELFGSGNPVSQLLASKNSTRCYIAALQAMAISVYVSNVRRLGKQAA